MCLSKEVKLLRESEEGSMLTLLRYPDHSSKLPEIHARLQVHESCPRCLTPMCPFGTINKSLGFARADAVVALHRPLAPHAIIFCDRLRKVTIEAPNNTRISSDANQKSFIPQKRPWTLPKC